MSACFSSHLSEIYSKTCFIPVYIFLHCMKLAAFYTNISLQAPNKSISLPFKILSYILLWAQLERCFRYTQIHFLNKSESQ